MLRNSTFTPSPSPLAPFGACSAIGHVDQNNILSAVRGWRWCRRHQYSGAPDRSGNKATQDKGRYFPLRRHRTDMCEGKRLTTFYRPFLHFCMVSGGWDMGNYAFELGQLNEHLSIFLALLRRHFQGACPSVFTEKKTPKFSSNG